MLPDVTEYTLFKYLNKPCTADSARACTSDYLTYTYVQRKVAIRSRRVLLLRIAIYSVKVKSRTVFSIVNPFNKSLFDFI